MDNTGLRSRPKPRACWRIEAEFGLIQLRFVSCSVQLEHRNHERHSFFGQSVPHTSESLLELLEALPVIQPTLPGPQGLGIAHPEALPVFQVPSLVELLGEVRPRQFRLQKPSRALKHAEHAAFQAFNCLHLAVKLPAGGPSTVTPHNLDDNRRTSTTYTLAWLTYDPGKKSGRFAHFG